MNLDLEAVAGSLKDRYVTVPRGGLPDGFAGNPAGTLADMAREYRQEAGRLNAGLANAHKDWAVRVELDPEHSMPVTEVGVAQGGQWVEFRGMVARIRQPVPRALEITWVCAKCGSTMSMDPEHGRPAACPCGSRTLDENQSMSTFVDSQHVVLAESFEEIRGSRPPRMLDCRLDGTLVQQVSPGDRVVLGGVLRLLRTKRGHDYELLVNNMAPFRPAKSVEAPAISGDIVEGLVGSFAPRVHGHHTIKESIILLMAGGSAALDGRTNLNILLVGDPGIAKSALLQEAAGVAPLGRYTSGRGATAAGLTAGLARDRDGVMYMEAGAAVLTDGGLLCVDEFDKTQKTDRAALHEVMEQQTASIAKLGIMVTMNARVSILAAANPKRGFWDDSMTLSENIDLPQSLLTRFDLIYKLRDMVDADTDRMIARHILRREATDTLPSEAVTAYIASVRPLKPEMSEEAAEAIEQYYVRARAQPGEIRITPRQLEAVKRLAGARAKICRRGDITMQDATRAIDLVEAMIQRTMVDPDTGQPDHVKAVGGQSRSAVRQVDEAIAALDGEFTAADIAPKVKVSFLEIERILAHLNQHGMILEGKPGVYTRVR